MATLRQSVITERVMALRAARDDGAVCVPCLAVLADTSERLMRTVSYEVRHANGVTSVKRTSRMSPSGRRARFRATSMASPG